MYAYKDLLELAGLTTRIYTLLSTLHNLPPIKDFRYPSTPEEMENPSIGLEGVRIRPPRSTEVLVNALDLRIRKGEHLMITGPVRACASDLGECVLTRGAEWGGEDGDRAGAGWPLGGGRCGGRAPGARREGRARGPATSVHGRRHPPRSVCLCPHPNHRGLLMMRRI